MIFTPLLIGSLIYLWWTGRVNVSEKNLKLNCPNEKPNRVTEFKNDYFPVESGAWAHAWRHIQGQGGWSTGNQIGRLEYANPLPYAVYNEFNSQLNETDTGYAIDTVDGLLKSKDAVDIQGQINLIEEWFGKEEHPRLDPTRQDITKGRYARHEWSFVPGRS